MSILGIDEITYGVEDVALGRRFFLDWGLAIADETLERIVFETQNGCRVIVARRDLPELPPPFEIGSTLREVVWGVEDDQDLARLRAMLAHHPSFVESGPRIGCTDPNGLAARFQVSVKRAVELKGSPANTWDRRLRVDQPGAIYERAQPVEVGHIVVFTDRVSELEAFYTRLGFVASDRYPGRGCFMRCAPRGGHHDLFMLQLPSGKRGLNHVAFTVRDINEVFGGGMHVSRCGWKTQLGPGRHPISSAYFWYFDNPCGGLIEYYADEDELTEAWQAREFEPGPTVFAEWAIEGGIDGNTRRQRSSKAAEGKFLTEKP